VKLTIAMLVSSAVLAGCNSVYGIDETEAVMTVVDTDGDGVRDEIDNCIDVPNVLQEESDGDALGDACDACPGVLSDSNHDEDDDGRPDGCDGCPWLDDFALDSDRDLDGVGDACDYDSHATARLYFEPFVSLDGWQGPGLWDLSADDTLGSTEPVPADARGLERADVTLGTMEWTVHTGIVSSRTWAPGDRAGIVMVGSTDAVTSCTIECDQTTCSLRLVVDDQLAEQYEVLPQPYLRLRFEVKLVNPGNNVHSYTCESSDRLVTYADQVPLGTSWTLGVVAGPTMRVSFVDAVQ
jgi:hypothetical protein